MRNPSRFTMVLPRRTMLAAVVAAVALGTVGPAAAGEPGVTVWLVNTRGASRACVSPSAGERIRCFVLDDEKHWQPSSIEALLGTLEVRLPTIIHVHGNRADRGAAVSDAFRLLRVIRRQAPDGSFRLVIWSWPSDRIRGGNRKDVRVKAAYSDVQGYYLAGFLRRVDPEVPVSLVGYSFGARIITVALHLLDGGRPGRRALAASPEKQVGQPALPTPGSPKRRAVLIAAALDAGWLAPGGLHGRAAAQVERMLIARNRCDPVLRLYPLMYRIGGPQALGYVGPICLGENRQKAETVDVTCAVGRAHEWSRYVAAPGLKRRLAAFTFLDPLPAKPPSPCPKDVPPAAP